MDPKQNTPTLDPKLQEVYNRVMGTTPTPTPPPNATMPTPPSPSDPLPENQTPPVSPISSPAEAVATLNTPLHMSTEKVTIGEGGSPVAAVVPPKGKGLSPVVLIFGAIAFLVVYAVFWIRFFGLNLPFLPH